MPFAPLQTINVGSYANDGTGDDLRSAFRKVNENFTALFNDLGVVNASNVGSGVGIFKQKTDNSLEFKTLVGASGITITNDTNTITIRGLASIQGDTAPTLGGDLRLNGHNIVGTGLVQGIDLLVLSTQVQSLFGQLDMGTFDVPNNGTVDLGGF
jgi:hypothetical protein